MPICLYFKTDIVVNLYRVPQYPQNKLTPFGFSIIDALTLGGSRITHIPQDILLIGAKKLDYIVIDENITAIGGELVDGDTDANTGLPKYGAPLAAGTSQIASDHWAVFADLLV